jgi:hypothetical protein
MRKEILISLNKIFDIEYGNGFSFNKMIANSAESNISFVARTSKNNGVVGNVVKHKDIEPFPAGLLTVAVSGSVLETFLQPNKFYTSFHVMVLFPKKKMSDLEKIFYCECIKKNKFRYNYGRQANKTLPVLLVPKLPPQKLLRTKELIILDPLAVSQEKGSLPDCKEWGCFQYNELFEIKKGKRLTKAKMKPGQIPFIGSIDKNNGISAYINENPIHEGNTISVNYNGSVAEAFYQEKPFWASDDVNVLYPKFKLTQHLAMFLVTIIRAEKYRFNYGRKWHLDRMKESIIKLPLDKKGEPDWTSMENYIKSLPYSKNLN